MNILSGYRVLDFGRYIAGPYCATLLADFGAEVIRIEKVDGSEDRFMTPVAEDGSGAMFLQMNRNKKGLTLNPTKPDGREVVRRLVATADVVVANLPPAGLKAMGVDYDSLKKIKPDIILTTASTFGHGGPYSERVGFDGLGQVMSGGGYLSGTPETPVKNVVPFVDFGTAMMSAYGTLAALMERQQTGQGQVVQGALLRTALTYANSYLIEQSATGINRVGTGNRSQISGPSDVIKTSDGWILIQVIGQPIFERWANMIGRADLLENPSFVSDSERGINGAELSALATVHASTLTTEQALDAYQRALVPAGPVLSSQQALDDPHINAMGFLQTMDYPGLNVPVPIATAPIEMGHTATGSERRAPQLGEHTNEILATLGYDDAAIDDLRKKRVI